MKGWRIIEGITVADVAYEAYGESIEELFVNAAMGLMEVMVDTKTVKKMSNVKCQMSNVKLEDLLFDFLSELVFLKDANNMLFSRFKVNISRPKTKNYQLVADLWGEEIDPVRHHLRLDVKAVTRHQFSLRKEEGKYTVRVVLDI